MSKLRFIGLDVHKDSIVIALAESGQAPAEVLKRIDWSEPRLLAELRKLGPVSELRVCYEAGPTGYGLQRFLAAAGVDCVVIAPSLVPQAQGDRPPRRPQAGPLPPLRRPHLRLGPRRTDRVAPRPRARP